MKRSAATDGPLGESFRSVRYIKLGSGGGWERECISSGIVRFGFGTARPDLFPLCAQGKWHDLARALLADGKQKGVATRAANETRTFFEDDGKILWITFQGEQLWWGTLTQQSPQPHSDGDGVFRVVQGGWKSVDANGDLLTKDRLSGALTKLASYRGTSCSVDVANYVIRRIRGQTSPQVDAAIRAYARMKATCLELTQELGPKDFEILVDLIFSTSGWRRIGDVGKTQKNLDLDIVLPSTGERALVQVKSRTNSKELSEYVENLEDAGPYDRMFFVHHSGTAEISDDRVTVIGPEKLAELIVDAGLVSWVIRKVS